MSPALDVIPSFGPFRDFPLLSRTTNLGLVDDLFSSLWIRSSSWSSIAFSRMIAWSSELRCQVCEERIVSMGSSLTTFLLDRSLSTTLASEIHQLTYFFIVDRHRGVTTFRQIFKPRLRPFQLVLPQLYWTWNSVLLLGHLRHWFITTNTWHLYFRSILNTYFQARL